MEQYNYISIDFGTSFCRAAILSQNGPILIPSSSSNRPNDYLFPTVAYVTDKGEIHTCHMAERKRMENPSRFLFEFKLNIGTKKSLFPDCDVTYTNIVTAILTEIKKDALKISNGRIIENLLLTIPAIYSRNDERLLVMKDAAKLAGFKKIELLKYADNYFDLKFSLENLLNRPVDLLEEQSLKNPFFLDAINESKNRDFHKLKYL